MEFGFIDKDGHHSLATLMEVRCVLCELRQESIQCRFKMVCLLHMFYARGRIAVCSTFIEKWRMSFVACCKLCPTFLSGGTKENTDIQSPSIW
jgi:hypothetical protein